MGMKNLFKCTVMAHQKTRLARRGGDSESADLPLGGELKTQAHPMEFYAKKGNSDVVESP